MIKTPRIFGWRWVTCSWGWMFWMVIFILIGLTGSVLLLLEVLQQGIRSVELVDVLIAGTGIIFVGLIPFLAVTGVFVSRTHVRRAPGVGRPSKVPLSEISEVWPLGYVRISSPAGDLLEIRKTAFSFRKEGVEWFDDFGRDFAELIGVVYVPESKPWPGAKAPLWSSSIDADRRE